MQLLRNVNLLKKVKKIENKLFDDFDYEFKKPKDINKKSKKYNIKFINKPILSPDNFVKVAYVLIMNEVLVEVVEVLNKKAKFSGGK